MRINETVNAQDVGERINLLRHYSYQQAVPSPRWKHTTYNLFLASCFLYILTTVLFAASLPKHFQYVVGTIAVVSSAWLMHRDYVRALYLMILVMSIGPIMSVGIPSVGNFNIADVFVLLLSLFFLSKHSLKSLSFGPFGRHIKILAVLTVASVFLCDDRRAVVTSVLNMVQFMLIYLITINVIKTRAQAKDLVLMIAFGIMVGAALHLVFYARGLSLWLASDSSSLNYLQTGEIESRFSDALTTDIFQRTSHFYGSFITPCGAAIVLGIMSLWLGKTSNRRYWLYWIVAIGLIGSSLLVTGNRTILLSCAISVAVLFAIRFAASPIKFLQQRFLFIACLIILCIGSAYTVQQYMLNDNQKAAYVETVFGTTANSSMSQRLSMWSHASHVFITEPKILFLGIGPDLAWRNPDNAKVAKIMFIPDMRFQVPSYHNFYIDTILNFGIMFLLVFLSIIIGTLKHLIRIFRRNWDEVSGACLCAVVMWLISWLTVSMTWGKVLLVLAQLLALAHLVGFGLLADNSLNRTDITSVGKIRGKSRCWAV